MSEVTPTLAVRSCLSNISSFAHFETSNEPLSTPPTPTPPTMMLAPIDMQKSSLPHTTCMRELIPSSVPTCLLSLPRTCLALSPSEFESYMRALTPNPVPAGLGARQAGLPQPPRATGVGQESLHVFLSVFHLFCGSSSFFCLFLCYKHIKTDKLSDLFLSVFKIGRLLDPKSEIGQRPPMALIIGVPCSLLSENTRVYVSNSRLKPVVTGGGGRKTAFRPPNVTESGIHTPHEL